MSVKKRGSKWQAIANYYDKDGKRHQKSGGMFKTKKEAVLASAELELDLQRTNMEMKDISFHDYYVQWFNTYIKSGLADVTVSRYEIIGREIEKYFKDTKLVDVNKTMFQQFINDYGAGGTHWKEGHAKSTVFKMVGVVSHCVSYAIDDDIITKDFTNNIRKPYKKEREYKSKYEYLNERELKILTDATIEGLDSRYTSRYMILTVIMTGMRKEEIQALTWKDIDEVHATISINKAWDERKKAFKDVKTDTSRRVISVDRKLIHYLQDLKANNSNMVFLGINHNIPTSNGVVKVLRGIMRDRGIEKQGFHFHSLRHTHVAYLLGNNVDIHVISKRLGHSSVVVTLNHYAYLLDEYKAKNDKLIDEKLSNLM